MTQLEETQETTLPEEPKVYEGTEQGIREAVEELNHPPTPEPVELTAGTDKPEISIREGADRLKKYDEDVEADRRALAAAMGQVEATELPPEIKAVDDRVRAIEERLQPAEEPVPRQGCDHLHAQRFGLCRWLPIQRGRHSSGDEQWRKHGRHGALHVHGCDPQGELMKFCLGCHGRVSIKKARRHSGFHGTDCQRAYAALCKKTRTCQPGTGWPESSHLISTRGGEGSASMVGLKSGSLGHKRGDTAHRNAQEVCRLAQIFGKVPPRR